MNWPRNIGFILILAALLTGCATQPEYGQRVNLLAGFSEYKTYRILAEHPARYLRGRTSPPIDPGLKNTLLDKLHEALTARGYSGVEETAKADIYFAITLGPRPDISLYEDYQKLGVRTWAQVPASGGRPSGDYNISLDAFDGQTGSAVWFGYAALGNLGKLSEAERVQAYAAGLYELVQRFPVEIQLPGEGRPMIRLIH